MQIKVVSLENVSESRKESIAQDISNYLGADVILYDKVGYKVITPSSHVLFKDVPISEASIQAARYEATLRALSKLDLPTRIRNIVIDALGEE